MRINKKAAAVAVAAVALTGTGVAYAYWSSTGGGTGSASTTAGETTAFSVSGGIANAMYPGDSEQTGTATVTNTSTSQNAHLASVKAYLTTDKSSCTGADYKLNGVAAPSDSTSAVDLGFTPVDLAHGATATKTFTLQFNNSSTADQSACKGAAVTIHYIAA